MTLTYFNDSYLSKGHAQSTICVLESLHAFSLSELLWLKSILCVDSSQMYAPS